jgi:aldehyde dehydrogenase (NAD+)
MEGILAKLRNSFDRNITKNFNWRKSQILALQKLVIDNETRIAEALNKDLGRGEFEALGTEVGSLLFEIQHVLNNLKSWMEPVYTQVPAMMEISTSEIQSEPYGVCLVMGAFNFPFSLLVYILIFLFQLYLVLLQIPYSLLSCHHFLEQSWQEIVQF